MVRAAKLNKRDHRNIYRMFQADCRAKDVNLKVHMGESLKLLGSGYMIKADPSRLQQTVVNLCSNAIKFTAKQDVREITLQVEVSTRPPVDTSAILPPGIPLPDSVPEDTPLFIYISVHDTGPGMTEEELAKLFRKFSQANNEIHVQMGGNGLGLFIAKQLCKLQHGAIEAVSRKGKYSGSTFRFYIAAKSVVAPVEIPRSNSMPRLPSTIENLVPLHILVVDDNVINRKTLDRQLKIHKHTVKTAEDGQQALVSRPLVSWATGKRL
jgi:signal transduction histidine kinase